MASAQRWLSSARGALDQGFVESAAADAYYAAFYGARGALSEEGQAARTHTGVWDLFYKSFVESGRFDRGLYAEARRIERLRLDAHYEALQLEAEEAARAVDTAERFVVAVNALLAR
jgi:uncharacterized protein (UPF0332 family)